MLNIIALPWYASIHAKITWEVKKELPALYVALVAALILDIIWIYIVFAPTHKLSRLFWVKVPWLFLVLQLCFGTFVQVGVWFFPELPESLDAYGVFIVFLVLGHLHGLYILFALYDYIKLHKRKKKARSAATEQGPDLELPFVYQEAELVEQSPVVNGGKR